MRRQKLWLGITLSALTMGLLVGCGQKETVTTQPEEVVNEEAAQEESKEAEAEEDSKETEVAETEVPELEGYNLLWNDEFDGDSLNEDIWNRELRDPGWTNEELQEYTDSDENIYVEDGKLILKAVKTEKDGKDYYTSGKVNSQNKADFTYGKVVASAKVPQGQGLWPAIWMMPQDEEHYGQWPKCGEIDIMEVLGNETDTAYTTIHYGEPHAQQQAVKTLSTGSFSEEFHEYSVEWEPGEIRWYIDGEEQLVVNDWFTATADGEEQPYPAPFDQPFFVQMNLAVGGTWPGNPDETTDFDNAKFEIDYVRVYQKDEYDTNVSKPEKVFREANADGNYINNSDFSDESEDLNDDVDRKFLLAQNGKGAATIKDGMIEITSEAEGDVEYSVQLVHWTIPVYQGKKYKVTYEAMAEEEREMKVAVTAPYVDWIRYYPDTTVNLTTDWKEYSFEFDMTEKDDNEGRLEFNMGAQGSTATICIRNVRFEEVK